jgi:hypothetical protein
MVSLTWYLALKHQALCLSPFGADLHREADNG